MQFQGTWPHAAPQGATTPPREREKLEARTYAAKRLRKAAPAAVAALSREENRLRHEEANRGWTKKGLSKGKKKTVRTPQGGA